MPEARPYGNSFLVATPALQNLEQRLYVEEKQRQQQNINNAKALDDEFSKNVSNIRDADVDDLTKAYQDYKTSTQATMRKKGGVSPQEQMEVLRKKAAMYKLINESKAEREREETYGKRYAIKPDDFNDDAATLLIKGRQLPLSQKRTYKTVGADGKETIVDLTNPENLLWQDKTNWQPILQKAGGTLAQRGQPVVVDLPGGLEQEITTYKGGNDPVQYFQSIMGAMNTPRASQSLASRYNFTPEEAQDIMMKFEELKKTPAFKNAYGDVKFPESAGISQGGKTAMLLAMTNAINNPPTANTPVRKANLAAVTANRQQFAKEQQARAHSNSLARLYVYAGIQDKKPESMGRNIDGLIAQHITDARDNNGQILVDNETFKSLTGQDKGSSSFLRVDDNGNYTYGKKDADGKETISGNIPLDAAKIKLTKTYKSGLDNRYNTGNEKPSQLGGSNTPTIRVPKDIKNTKVTKKPSWAN